MWLACGAECQASNRDSGRFAVDLQTAPTKCRVIQAAAAGAASALAAGCPSMRMRV